MKHVTRLMLLVTILTLTTQARAQANRDLHSVLRAAVDHVRGALPSGQVLLDPRVLSTQEGDLLATSVGARIATEAAARVCGATPSDCRLIGGNSLIVIQSLPMLSGDTAVVQLLYYEATRSTRQPVASREIRVDLARTKGAWHVIASKPTRMS
jgi:hypothetical protein